MHPRITAAVAAIGIAVTAHAETLRCEFSTGVINSEDRHRPGPGPGYVRQGWQKPESVAASAGQNPDLTFIVKFTPGNDTATVAGNNDIATVKVVATEWFRSFVEVTRGGGVHVMTVDRARDGEGRYLAAYSRHAIVFDSLVVSQYWGYCR